MIKIASIAAVASILVGTSAFAQCRAVDIKDGKGTFTGTISVEKFSDAGGATRPAFILKVTDQCVINDLNEPSERPIKTIELDSKNTDMIAAMWKSVGTRVAVEGSSMHIIRWGNAHADVWAMPIGIDTMADQKTEQTADEDVANLQCKRFLDAHGSQLGNDWWFAVADLVPPNKFALASACNKASAVEVLCKRNPNQKIGDVVTAISTMPKSKIPQVRCGA